MNQTHMHITRGEPHHQHALLSQILQNLSAVRQDNLNNSAQIVAIQVENQQVRNFADQRHHEMVGHIAAVQQRVIDRQEPVEMLKIEMAALREQLSAGEPIRNSLRHLETLIQGILVKLATSNTSFGKFETRYAHQKAIIKDLIRVQCQQRNEIITANNQIAALNSTLTRAGFFGPSANPVIHDWLENTHHPQVPHTELVADRTPKQETLAGLQTSPAPSSVGGIRVPVPTPEAALIPTPATDHHTSRGVTDGDISTFAASCAIKDAPTPASTPCLNPHAPTFVSKSTSPSLSLRGGDLVLHNMVIMKDTGKGAVGANPTGMESSMWAPRTNVITPAREERAYQPRTAPAPIIDQPSAGTAAATNWEAGLKKSMWASRGDTAGQPKVVPVASSGLSSAEAAPTTSLHSEPKKSMWAPRDDISDQPKAAPVPTIKPSPAETAPTANWESGLRQSMWAPREDTAGRSQERPPKASRAVVTKDHMGNPLSGETPALSQETKSIDLATCNPFASPSTSAGMLSSSAPGHGPRAPSATADNATTNSSTTPVQNILTDSKPTSNSSAPDRAAQFLPAFARLAQEHGFSPVQAANLINVHVYGDVNHLVAASAGVSSAAHAKHASNDDGQLIPGVAAGRGTDGKAAGDLSSRMSGLALLDDDANAQHLQAPMVPSVTKKRGRGPFNFEEEMKGVVLHNGKLAAKKPSAVPHANGAQKEKNVVPAQAMEPDVPTSNATGNKSVKAKAADHIVTVTTPSGHRLVTDNGNVTVTFHNVKFKTKAKGAERPLYKLGHLNQPAYDHVSISLVFITARGKSPMIAIKATNRDETLITVTFTLPTYVQTMDFIKVAANTEAVLPNGSEPMNELNTLKDPNTGIIPGNLYKVSFAYNACDTKSVIPVVRKESELAGMNADDADLYRFFAAFEDFEGGSVEALFTDEGNDAGKVDEVLGVFEKLYRG